MLELMKPGHVLRFATDPAGIASPAADDPALNDNTRETAWTAGSSLGLVRCVSHPSGALGAIAAEVATRLRTTPGSKARTVGYSGIGRALTASDRAVGSATCDFVGYVDGRSNYIRSDRTVFSKDFSGCLMVAYTVDGQRRVAHAAASKVATMDCKQAFLDKVWNMGATLDGWFRPFMSDRDSHRKETAFGLIGRHLGHQVDRLTTFGVITQAGQAWSLDAFKPTPGVGADWIVTDVRHHAMCTEWRVG